MPQKMETEVMERLKMLMNQAELLRGALGLTRGELAEAIGVDLATYSRAYRLLTVPHLETVYALEAWIDRAKAELQNRLRMYNLVA